MKQKMSRLAAARKETGRRQTEVAKTTWIQVTGCLCLSLTWLIIGKCGRHGTARDLKMRTDNRKHSRPDTAHVLTLCSSKVSTVSTFEECCGGSLVASFSFEFSPHPFNFAVKRHDPHLELAYR